jgi:protein TonB
MLFKPEPTLQPDSKKRKTLTISVALHVLLVLLVLVDPDLFKSAPKRFIRIAGEEYDLSNLTPLVPPPAAAAPRPPAIAENKPMVQPALPEPAPAPQPQPPAPQPQPPPPPPPQPPPPDVLIRPDDVLAEGARPDGQPRASRGSTEEKARPGGPSAEAAIPTPAPAPARPKAETPQVAQNNNPNALNSPNFLDRSSEIVNQQIQQARRSTMQGGGGPRTGLGNGHEDADFSTEEPKILSDTRGYDFGPYMNQVINTVRVNWYYLIPEIARLGQKGRVVIIFTITASGRVQEPHIVSNSGLEPLDRAALGSITASDPFQKLPAGFSGNQLVLQFTFLYNIRPR